MASFDVLQEAWIPTVDHSGHKEELGIMPLLLRAHELREISDASPLASFGMHRVLIAFLMDAYNLRTVDDWLDIWECRRFAQDVLQSYVESCGNRFDLFDGKRPFLQSARDANAEKKEKMISTLLPELASGNNPIHFDHYAAAHRISPAAATRALCGIADFSNAGLQGPSGVTGAPPWYVLLRGNNLFETLLLNSYVEQLPEHISRDSVPPWRRAEGTVINKLVESVGFLEGLVFQPRYLRLIPDETGGVCTLSNQKSDVLVSSLFYAPGFNLQDKGRWKDPHAAYVETDEAISTLKPRQGKAPWRDMGALLLLESAMVSPKRRCMRPLIINQFENLARTEGILNRADMIVDIYGLYTDQAKLLEWQYERMAVPLQLLALPDGCVLVQQMIDLAERTERTLLQAVNQLLPQKTSKSGQTQKRKDGEDVLALEARTLYWETIEKEFKMMLEELTATGESADLQLVWGGKWRKILRDKARRVLLKIIEQTVGDYSREAAAEKFLQKELNKALKSQTTEENGKGGKV